MDLEVKRYSIYQPFDLKVQYDLNGDGKHLRVGTLTGIRNQVGNELIIEIDRYGYLPEFCKPILKSLNDLDINIMPKNLQNYTNKQIQPHNVYGLSYRTFELLLENHYDVFGLIEKGLAVDINTLSVQNDG